MFDASLVKPVFDSALPYADFVATGEPEGHHQAWNQRYDQTEPDEKQRALIDSFVREMKVLCLTGTWCGDCALQGAAMQRIAEAANGTVDLRFIGRDEAPQLQVRHPINAGFRVPITFFMAEDHEPVSRFGDRTLSRYRSMARKALGEKSPVVAPAPDDPVRAVLQEVLDEFERVQLLLRTSTRLRERHGD